jgi:alkylation response protein AidB-like acyl-CoA dehydrogenase
MRFEPGDEAAALREAVEGQLQAVTPSIVRAGWPGGDDATVRAAWRKLADGGTLAALVPEELGGLGLDEVAVVEALDALGYSGLPLPVVETIAVAAPLLAGVDSVALEAVISGAAIVTAAPHPDGGDLLPFGQVCDLALLVDGPAIRLCAIADIDCEPVAAIDGSRRLARVRAVRGGRVVTADPATIERAGRRGALGTAAVLTGLSRRMLDITVDYVGQRQQFGVAIGSFQAIKHALASALLAVRFAQPPVLAAAWALAHDAPDAGIRVSLAKAMASEAALRVARTAIQCHGAIAYTTEYDLHLFAKRAWALAPAWGDGQWHRDQIAEYLGVTAASER